MSTYEIDLSNNYIQPDINEKLYRDIINYKEAIDDIQYLESENKYFINISGHSYSDKPIKIGNHFFFNKQENLILRYNYFNFKINEQLYGFIKNKMETLFKFINDKNITFIKIRTVDVIKLGFFNNIISNYVENLLDNIFTFQDIIDSIIILGLIRKLNNIDDQDLSENNFDISINNNMINMLIRTFEKQNITLYTIDDIIIKKLYTTETKSILRIFDNILFTNHNSKIYKHLYEFKFIYTFKGLVSNIIQLT
jgi:hypothetical protein